MKVYHFEASVFLDCDVVADLDEVHRRVLVGGDRDNDLGCPGEVREDVGELAVEKPGRATYVYFQLAHRASVEDIAGWGLPLEGFLRGLRLNSSHANQKKCAQQSS